MGNKRIIFGFLLLIMGLIMTLSLFIWDYFNPFLIVFGIIFILLGGSSIMIGSLEEEDLK